MSDSQPTAVLAGGSMSGAANILERGVKPYSPTRDAARRIARNPGAVAGAIVLVVIVLLTIFAPAIAPDDPNLQNSQALRAAPSRNHLFGTDRFGRDVFSRTIYGGRKSLPVGVV